MCWEPVPAIAAGLGVGFAVRLPNRPCISSCTPEVKYIVLELPAEPLLPGIRFPQVRDHDRVAAAVGQFTDKLVILQVIRFDGAVAEIADQQIAAKRTEARRRNGEAP